MSLFPADLYDTAANLVRDLASRELRVATVESCTGGLLASLLTEVPGSSDVLDRGFVTYANEAKTDLVAVDAVLIMAHGAVSREVVIAMAEGALANSAADLAVAITGIAGPGGGSETKPVGLVHLACARRDGVTVASEHRFGDLGRTGVRLAAVAEALRMLKAAVNPG